MRPIYLAAAAILTISACAGMSDVMKRYGPIKPVSFDYAGAEWRAFDNPDKGQIMITPSIARAGSAGMKAGITFGIGGDQLPPDHDFRAAAQAFISGRKPACKVTDGRKLITAQYEYDYAC